MSFKIIIDERRNDSLLAKLKDTSPLMQKISKYALSASIAKIDKGISPDNAQITKDVKQGDKTLRDRGGLLASLHARNTAASASVSSSHVAAALANPDDGREYTVIKPIKAKALTIPAGPQTRTLMRRYGFTPKAVLDGLKADGYEVYRPFKAGSKSRANVIMAVLKPKVNLVLMSSQSKVQKNDSAQRLPKKYQPFAVFILVKSVKIPARRFFFLTPEDDTEICDLIEGYYQ